ncbi:ubiE/COQ5 methyltransferase [Paraphaeosphaeria sporulosa]|uniref:Arsenite methyltransferase n=1 Tax=Paraphaeosphaeria sporulosa TaxID=1460663 RepID=A0A177C5G9_9PLEO|nr:ubiE/COQ5 methyltransferase [Paraphaeosphaeria sporulosa]OAG02018.1 ubiE/COQ5 methyltransferase [Paraphaeosphaeria sporulosa]
MNTATITKAVDERYTASASAPPHPAYCNAVAQAFGYSASDLLSIPSEANLGLSCGNPLALANLHEGETVIDLGCGAGLDCFLAARKVGGAGSVVGVDMNETMLTKARENASKAGISNTTFLLSRITAINLPDATADVVISNCVINLVPRDEKHLVFKEIFRLLKPGGRVAVSDILTKKGLSEEMKRDVALYVGCVAGASMKADYEAWMEQAGFREVIIVDAGVDLNVYARTENKGVGAGCCEPKNVEDINVCSKERDRGSDGSCGSVNTIAGVSEGMKTNFQDVDLNQWAGSFKIFAVKGA